MKKHLLLLSILTLINTSIAASETAANTALQDKIESAINQFEQTNKNEWSFQVSRYENEEGTVTSSIERYDPRNPEFERWTLLSRNGSEPTAKEKQTFATQKVEDGDKHSSVLIKLVELIQTDSLQLVSENDDVIVARFDVYLERLGEAASKHLQGELIYAKSKAFIQQLTITNTADFSPVFSANISDFALNIDFMKIDSAIFAQEVSLTMKGRFALFVAIDEVSKDTYSNFEYWGL